MVKVQIVVGGRSEWLAPTTTGKDITSAGVERLLFMPYAIRHDLHRPRRRFIFPGSIRIGNDTRPIRIHIWIRRERRSWPTPRKHTARYLTYIRHVLRIPALNDALRCAFWTMMRYDRCLRCDADTMRYGPYDCDTPYGPMNRPDIRMRTIRMRYERCDVMR